ncbi:MAG TPA: BREX system P-loop protein BrxC [Spirochaetales bacterium]|nr:BREX system P-loop protein BrxC [Spirochaetales bacterium]
MERIRDLFSKTKKIDRRIEKVITYSTTDEEQLKQEITEYVATENLERQFEYLLDQLDSGITGSGIYDIGVWVSGFYGSGKSSFTKYLGFALDPNKKIEGKEFLYWLQDQFPSHPLRQRLSTVAKTHPVAVIMLDLASEQLAGAAMAEISSVLYSKVMQWAGYSKDRKVAYLELMLERDGRKDAFTKRIKELGRGESWERIREQPLLVKTFASQLAAEFYPELWPDAQSFNTVKIDEAVMENDRVREMLDLVRRKSGQDNVLFVIDEVGQYVSARDDLILNLDGLAKNLKEIGGGKAWLIATAQQTLTEDSPHAQLNTAKLYKLADRFPIKIDLEASDIREICYKRLLSKSKTGDETLAGLYDRYGEKLKHLTKLENTRYYKSDLDKKAFCQLYPFLPQHFDILLQLLGRLAKTSGGIGLRSAIKIIQDILVDRSGLREGDKLLADQKVGNLATTVTFYDTLRQDIQKSFRHITEGVGKATKVFGPDSFQEKAAKSVAVLQILEDFPVSKTNLSALMYPELGSETLFEQVKKAVDNLISEPSVPLSEIDGSLRFMSEAVNDLEKERQKIVPLVSDIRSILYRTYQDIFKSSPAASLESTKKINAGMKFAYSERDQSFFGDKEEIQYAIVLVEENEYKRMRQVKEQDSRENQNSNTVFLIARKDKGLDDLTTELHRSQKIYNDNRSREKDREVSDYLTGQRQRAMSLGYELSSKLRSLLQKGSFVFRGQPEATDSLGSDIIGSVKAHLAKAAAEIFDKYKYAPVQVDSVTAEKFLKTDDLYNIASRNDPLNLVKREGPNADIDTSHQALTEIINYLQQHAPVDGRKLLDHFSVVPFGWSKDTTRYCVAALLTAGELKLKISGQDFAGPSPNAIEGIKNTVNFNKAGISLRGEDDRSTKEQRLKACERLIALTGEKGLPLEQDISKQVLRHFPDMQSDYSQLALKLENLELPGVDRAQSLHERITELLKGDASDSVKILGAKDCPLYDDIFWAREIVKAFDNRIGDLIKSIHEQLKEIPQLPDTGIFSTFKQNTQAEREELKEYLSLENFYEHYSDLQKANRSIKSKTNDALKQLQSEMEENLLNERKRIESLPEWSIIGEDERIAFGERLDRLEVTCTSDLQGMKKLIGDGLYFSGEMSSVEGELNQRVGDIQIGEFTETKDYTFSYLPDEITSFQEIDEIIKHLQELKSLLARGVKLKIRWGSDG